MNEEVKGSIEVVVGRVFKKDKNVPDPDFRHQNCSILYNEFETTFMNVFILGITSYALNHHCMC